MTTTAKGSDQTDRGTEHEADRDRLHALLEQAPVGIFVADAEGRFTEVNAAGCALIGRGREEIIGRAITDFLAAEDSARLWAEHEKLLQGKLHVGEWTMLRADGSEVLVEVSAKILSDGRWQAVISDLSDRVRLEASLRESLAELSRAQAVAKLGSWHLDLERNELVWSDETHRIFGTTPGTPMSYEAFLARVHPDDRAYVDARWQAALGGEPYDIEHRIIAGDAVKWVREKADLEFDEHGLLRRGVGVVHDISERKRVEDQQRFLAEVGSILAQATPDYDVTLTELARLAVRELADWAVLDLVDTDHVRRVEVACADPAHEELAAELERLPLALERRHLAFDALASQRAVLVAEVTPAYLESVAQSPAHLRLLRALDMHSLITVPLMGRGRPLGALALISSRDARRYRPSDLRFAEELARIAALAIENAQLYRTAQRAIAARDEVLGMVAHDLRSPLSAVLWQSELLRRPRDERRNVRPVDAIRRSALRMNRLIEDMLDVARLEAGALAITRAPVATRGLLDELVEAQREPAARGGHELHLDVPAVLPALLGDHDRLLQVLENLVSNAIKFTPAGGPIVIAARPGADELELSVSDTGTGLSEEHLAHVFDRFWQAARDRRGAGLGLAIAKGIVEAHSGRIWAESQLGRGTTFHVTVPLAPSAEVPHAAALAARP